MHPMQEIIESGQGQVTKDEALKTGRYNKAAASIWGAFGKGQDNHKTRILFELVNQGFTFAEYDQIERMAIEMAAQADAATGFSPPAESKGRAKYGPKQSAMAQRGSERRQVFGTLKQNASVIVHVPDGGIVSTDLLPAFDVALAKAREWLRKNSLNWEGQKRVVMTLGARQQGLLQTSIKNVNDEVMQANPKLADETTPAYYARIGRLVDEKAQGKLEELEQGTAENIAKKLIKQYGYDVCLKVADCILGSSSTPGEASDDVQEATKTPVMADGDEEGQGSNAAE